MENPAGKILEVAMSFAVPRCLHMVTEFGVPDALGDNPRTAADLAADTGANAGTLDRALRLLSAHGIFEELNKAYVHTPASRLLRTDHPQSMRSFVRMLGLPIYWKSFELLHHTFRTGKSAGAEIMIDGIWAYLARHPEESRIFDEAMTARAHSQIAGIVSRYDFSSFTTIADIGGGRGHLLHAVLEATPGATGILFDLPRVMDHVADLASPRMKLQRGDFFKDPLPVCDAYMAMQVIHNWNDQEARQILRAIHRAAPAHAKVLLIEGIVPDDSIPALIKMADIFMLVLFNGKERTRREFEDLFAASGFHLDRVVDIGLGTSILEASVVLDER